MIPHVFTGSLPNQETLWVLDGEGSATPKWTGTSCIVMRGDLYKACPERIWSKVTINDADHCAAWAQMKQAAGDEPIPDETYELCGPKIKDNPHGFAKPVLCRHKMATIADMPTQFEEMRAFLEGFAYEGVVWWHPDGRQAQLTKEDMGLEWP